MAAQSGPRRAQQQPHESKPSDALAQLKAGEITLDAYLDAKADKAVLHLQGLVPAGRLRMIRELLREQLETDPVCVRLVQRVTGQAPGEPT